MIQWAIIIINLYVWFNPHNAPNSQHFNPCNSANIEKYAIKEEKRLDFFQDCAIINGQAANPLLELQSFRNEKDEQEYIDKVRKYYDKK